MSIMNYLVRYIRLTQLICSLLFCNFRLQKKRKINKRKLIIHKFFIPKDT